MTETIFWDESDFNLRLAVAEGCGWAPRKARSLAAISWQGLTPAAKRVLERHGIRQ